MINMQKSDLIKNAIEFIDKFIEDKKFKIAQQKEKQKQMISSAFQLLQAQWNAKKYADGLEESMDEVFDKQLEKQILGKILKIKFKNHLFQEFQQQHSLFEIQDLSVRQTSPKTKQIISNLLDHIDDQSQKYADSNLLVPIMTEVDNHLDPIDEAQFFCNNQVLISDLFDALFNIMPSEDLNLSEQYIIADKNIFVNETEVRIKKQILKSKFSQEELDMYNNLIRFYKPINNKVDKVNTLNLIFEKDNARENFKQFNKKQGAILQEDADPSFQLINQFLLRKNETKLTSNKLPSQYQITQGKLLLFDLDLSPIDIQNLAEFLEKAGAQQMKSLHLSKLIIHNTLKEDEQLAQVLSAVRQHRNTIQDLHLSKVNFGIKSQLIFLDIVDVLQSLTINGLTTKTIRKARIASAKKPQTDSDSYYEEEEDNHAEAAQDSSQALMLKSILEYSRRLQILKITNINMNSCVPLINKIILKMPFIGELDLSSTFLTCQSLAQISNQLKRNAGGLYMRFLSLAHNKLNFDISSYCLNKLSNQKQRLLNQQITYKKEKQNVLKANPKVLASIQFLANFAVFVTNCKTLIHLDISSMGLGKCTSANLLNTQSINENLDLKQNLERLMDALSCKNTNLLAVHLSDNDFQNFHYQQSENVLRSFTNQFQKNVIQADEEVDLNSILREIVSQFQKMKQEAGDKKSTDEYFDWFIKCKEIKYERQKIQTFSEITFVNKDLNSFLNQDGFIKTPLTIPDHSLMTRPFLDHPELSLFQPYQNIDGWIENKSIADTCLFCHKHRYTLIFLQPDLENQVSNGDLQEIQNKSLGRRFSELNSKLGSTNSPIILGSLFNQPITRMVRADIFTLMLISKNKVFVDNEEKSKKLIETIFNFSKFRFQEENLKVIKEKLKGWNRILFDFINYNNYVDVFAINQPKHLPELNEDSSNSQYYVAAAYVPPGKHAFIIYDPFTQKIFQKEIVVLPSSKDTFSNTNFLRTQVPNKINIWGPRQMIENDSNKWEQAWEAIISTISQEVAYFTKKASPSFLIKILQKQFQKLSQIFTFYSANSQSYPQLDWQSFLLAIKSLEKEIEPLDVGQLPMAQIEILFISSAQTKDGMHQITNLNDSLSRKQFFQAIIKWSGTVFRQLNMKPEFQVFFQEFISKVCNENCEIDNIEKLRLQIQEEKQINDTLLENFHQLKGVFTYYSTNFFKIINELNNQIDQLEEAKALREEEEAAELAALDENGEKKKPKEIKKRKVEEEIEQKYKFDNVTDFIFLIMKQLLPNLTLTHRDIQRQIAFSKISVFESSILESQKFKKLTFEEFLEFLCRIYFLKNKNKFLKKTFSNFLTKLHQAHYDLNIFVKPIPFSVLKKQREEEEKQAAVQAMQSQGKKKKKNKEKKKANFPTPFLDEEVKQIQELYQKGNYSNR